jgi:hypothetical protein
MRSSARERGGGDATGIGMDALLARGLAAPEVLSTALSVS